ncbi:MAG: bacterioferritin [Dehalococcoidia bacterium]
MKSKEGVVELLNQLLTDDMAAINQYFMHAVMCQQWGYERLYHKLREMSIGEMRDVERIIHRILYLEGLPNLQRQARVEIGESVEEHLRLDLTQEQNLAQTLAQTVAHCGQVGDFATRGMLEEMLRHQDSDIEWLETQLETIKQVGIQNYLSQQIEE